MRLLKLAFISIIVFALLITGISLFFPSHIRISKAINIKATKDSIIAQISDASKWKSWYPGIDSATVLYVNGKVKGVILDNSDTSHPVYIGITGEKEDEVTAKYVSKKLKPVDYGWKVISYPSGDSTTLQWYMDFHLRWYPWEKFGSLMLEPANGAKMERGLTNLKKLVQMSN